MTYLKNIVLLVTAIALASVAVVVWQPATVHADHQPGCDGYAIMRCGADSPGQFITKLMMNEAGDLPAIYEKFGLSQSDYAHFGKNAKQGTLQKNGDIIVDGVKVGSSTLNIGRIKTDTFNQKVRINGKNYWGGSFASTYHANAADVSVMFNDTGVAQFVSIDSCGNPQQFTPNKPAYQCDKIVKKKIKGNQYEFSVRESSRNGATVSKVVYDFGDGTKKTVTSANGTVRYTFDGDAKVTARIHYNLPGGAHDSVTSVDCRTQITVTEEPEQPDTPFFECTQLVGVLTDADRRTYRFTATAAYAASLTFDSATFDFGDGQVVSDVQPNGNNEAVISHDFPTDKTYTINATLYLSNNKGAGDTNCQTTISIATPTDYCKPGVPVGSEECGDELIKSGPVATIATFTGFTALAGTAHYAVRRWFGASL